MKILHLTPHLGGGVGKAHSSICAADTGDVQRQYLLLERPRDRRYVDLISQTGVPVTVAQDPDHVRHCVREADILQIEWWNHPRLYQCLVEFDLPAARTVVWSHISGLFAPYIPEKLFGAVDHFLFTSPCSLRTNTVPVLTAKARQTLGVVNSGFGFEVDTEIVHGPQRQGRVAYLGTVHFSKMSRAFFDVIDQADLPHPVDIWGTAEANGEVYERAARMKFPQRIQFRGHVETPELAFERAAIFLYLLQPQHFGTAENALIEAMSMGCVPLVFANPAEREIVEHGKTGFIESNVADAARRLVWMVNNPTEIARMGQEAANQVASRNSARLASSTFSQIYRNVLRGDKRKIDYVSALGERPIDWYSSTQDPATRFMDTSEDPRKGSLAHFLSCFPADQSLAETYSRGRLMARV